MKAPLFVFLLGSLMGSLIGCAPSVRTTSAQAPAFDLRAGEPAPEFSVYDSQGERQTLQQYRGSYVVLEWTNLACPQVDIRYDTGYLPKLQQAYTTRGVVWLSVISSATGRQGSAPRDRMNALLAKRGAAQTAVLLDADGAVGHAYGARVTPQAVVVNPDGLIVYSGALDDQPKATEESLSQAVNYVAQALEDALGGRAVAVPRTEPYGCDVRYSRARDNQ
ncbi:MAG: redoxin family protein [Rhodothermales bacterium]|nr:redoxin family protein [Rhodothermales bacterium]